MSDSSFLSDLENKDKDKDTDKMPTEEEMANLTRRQRMALLAKYQ